MLVRGSLPLRWIAICEVVLKTQNQQVAGVQAQRWRHAAVRKKITITG